MQHILSLIYEYKRNREEFLRWKEERDGDAHGSQTAQSYQTPAQDFSEIDEEDGDQGAAGASGGGLTWRD